MLPLIITAAFLSRILFITQFPPSLNWDEVSLGYNAYSLLLTGRDEWGVAFPAIFRAFGDYKLPGYIYFSVLPTAILGLNPLSTRLTSVIFGTILIASTYTLYRKLFPSPQLRRGVRGEVVAAILAAFSPWSWFLSRIALEANVAASIFSAGIALYLSKLSPVLTTLFLTLPVWIYNSYRVFIPLMIIPLWLLNRKKISVITAMVVLLPMFGQIFLTSGQARFKWVSILDSAAIGKIEYLRNNSGSKFKTLLYNRYSYILFNFSKNYISHFTPNFLFLSGNTNFQFNIPGQGLIFLIFAPFFYWGIYDIFKNRNYLLIFWLILAPVASSLTKDSPHVLRSITFLPLPFLLIARQLSRTNNKIILFLIFILFIGHWTLYIGHWKNYRNNFSWSFQYGYKELSEYIEKNKNNYDEIWLTKKYGEPHIFLLYYQQVHPGKYIADPNLNRYFRSDWYWVDSFAKFRYINDWEFLEKTQNLNPDLKYLLVSSTEIPATKLLEIKYLDNHTAFYIYEK